MKGAARWKSADEEDVEALKRDTSNGNMMWQRFMKLHRVQGLTHWHHRGDCDELSDVIKFNTKLTAGVSTCGDFFKKSRRT